MIGRNEVMKENEESSLVAENMAINQFPYSFSKGFLVLVAIQD
jgi:hypothetical protein